MKQIDERAFGSWSLIMVMALLFGALFAVAAALIQLVTGGGFVFGRSSLVFGLAGTTSFLLVAARVRSQMDEDSDR